MGSGVSRYLAKGSMEDKDRVLRFFFGESNRVWGRARRVWYC